MELMHDLLPPLPNIQDIGPEETKETIVEVVCSLSPGSNLHDKNKIQDILLKHLKVPKWDSSPIAEKITVVCNFNHKTQMFIKSILRINVRCSECRSKITELSEMIYKSGLDKKIFEIVRINKLGQVVLRCLAHNHKMRFTYDIQHIQEIPTYCPECIVESSSPFKSEEMDFAKHLQDINQKLGNNSDSDMEEYFKYDSYLHYGGDKDEGPSNIDFDMEDFDTVSSTGYAVDTDSDIEQHHPGGGCCSDNDYENYFDSIPFGDELMSVEDEVAEELEDSQINHIISTVISRNYTAYSHQKEKAYERFKNGI